MKLNFFILTIFYIFLANCGFQIVDQNYFKEYKFVETKITGDKRVAYLLRNKLRVGNETASKSIKLALTTKKQKEIKEKNIQNEVTKYEITITANINYDVIDSGSSGTLEISKQGSYAVSEKYSDTLNNEKRLIKDLVNNISDQILRDLSLKLNDL